MHNESRVTILYSGLGSYTFQLKTSRVKTQYVGTMNEADIKCSLDIRKTGLKMTGKGQYSDPQYPYPFDIECEIPKKAETIWLGYVVENG